MGDHDDGRERITIGSAEGTLGVVLVAMSKRGICAIGLGDDRARLTRDVQERFAVCTIVEGLPDDVVEQVIEAVEHPDTALALPLDPRGTAFQLEVWEALRAIPVGHPTTYADLARDLGRPPTAARAVATAIAANRLAVVVPCHRVVRGDGGLGGYRWGVHRKRALLQLEARGAGPELFS